jgi:hypothetical protein
MGQMMKRIVLTGVALMVLSTWAQPAYAVSPRDPGPAGSRDLPSFGRAYCDNFYSGPPMATTASGAPLPELHKQWVYWCYPENTGYWIPTSAAI